MNPRSLIQTGSWRSRNIRSAIFPSLWEADFGGQICSSDSVLIVTVSIGQQFSLIEQKVFLSLLLQRCNTSLASEIKLSSSLVIYAPKEVPIVFHPRKDTKQAH